MCFLANLASGQMPLKVEFASGGENALDDVALQQKTEKLAASGVNHLDMWKHFDEDNKKSESCYSGIAIGLTGPLDKCKAIIAKHGSGDPFKTVSWWWVDAPKDKPTTLRYKIKKNGISTVEIMQNGVVIGEGRARTNSNRELQPKAGTYSAHKEPVKSATKEYGEPARPSYKTSKKVGFTVYMSHPIHIYEGFYAHGGNNSGESGGCMRVNELYRVEYGFNVTKIIIEHV